MSEFQRLAKRAVGIAVNDMQVSANLEEAIAKEYSEDYLKIGQKSAIGFKK
jgi:hypothetical protein